MRNLYFPILHHSSTSVIIVQIKTLDAIHVFHSHGEKGKKINK